MNLPHSSESKRDESHNHSPHQRRAYATLPLRPSITQSHSNNRPFSAQTRIHTVDLPPFDASNRPVSRLSSRTPSISIATHHRRPSHSHADVHTIAIQSIDRISEFDCPPCLHDSQIDRLHYENLSQIHTQRSQMQPQDGLITDRSCTMEQSQNHSNESSASCSPRSITSINRSLNSSFNQANYLSLYSGNESVGKPIEQSYSPKILIGSFFGEPVDESVGQPVDQLDDQWDTLPEQPLNQTSSEPVKWFDDAETESQPINQPVDQSSSHFDEGRSRPQSSRQRSRPTA